MTPPPETCPNCGTEVPTGALACPECGSDAATGWSDRATEERLGIPTDDFDYDRFLAEELGSGKTHRAGLRRWAPLGALVLVILFLWLLFR